MVGVAGFEPAVSRSQTERFSQTKLHPEVVRQWRAMLPRLPGGLRLAAPTRRSHLSDVGRLDPDLTVVGGG